MRSSPVSSAFRGLATLILFAVAGALSLPSYAGRLVQPDAVGAAAAAASPVLKVKAADAVGEVVEYFHPVLDHYFITADPIEQAAVDSGAAGAWQRTGNSFRTGGGSQVCRFYGSLSPGPNSHFYTADAAECAALKALQATTPSTQKRWNFESNDFLTTPAANGACPAALVPVYRAYNRGFTLAIDSNHRITSNLAAHQQTVARGWSDEGIVMCAPQPAAVTLPAQFTACGADDCPAAATALGNGVNRVNVIVEVANGTNAAVEIVIPAGQTFTAGPNTFQDGLAFESLRMTFPPGVTSKFVLRLFSLNQDRDESTTSTVYASGPITASAQLLDLMALGAGKLGSALDPGTLKATATQFAIWEITDGTGTLNAQQRSLLTQLYATAADDLTAQSTLFEQFQATLSVQPE